jgi:hypothetical protein
MNTSVAHSPWWSHLLFVAAGLGLWFWTQNLIGEQQHERGTIGDTVHVLLAAPNLYLQTHRSSASVLLIASSAVIDVLGIFLLLRSVFGPTLRPFLGLLLLFGMRQICQMLTTLDPPVGMVWHDPGFPSLLVTYHVATDFFFSGHTGIAVLGAVELARWGGRRWLWVGLAIVAFEATTVLLLRAHYTMDVFTGAVAARYATLLAERIAPWCDATLSRAFQRA